MTMEEVMSEFAQYTDAGEKLQDSFTKVALLAPGDPILSMEPKMPLSAKDVALFFKDGRNCGLVDFSSKPPSYTDSQEDTFDMKFPFPDDFEPTDGTLRLNNWRWSPDVRAGDRVRVMVAGIMKYFKGCDNPKCDNPYCGAVGFTEKMWERSFPLRLSVLSPELPRWNLIVPTPISPTTRRHHTSLSPSRVALA